MVEGREYSESNSLDNTENLSSNAESIDITENVAETPADIPLPARPRKTSWSPPTGIAIVTASLILSF